MSTNAAVGADGAETGRSQPCKLRLPESKRWVPPLQLTSPTGELQSTFDTLVKHVEAHLNMKQIEAMVWDNSS